MTFSLVRLFLAIKIVLNIFVFVKFLSFILGHLGFVSLLKRSFTVGSIKDFHQFYFAAFVVSLYTLTSMIFLKFVLLVSVGKSRDPTGFFFPLTGCSFLSLSQFKCHLLSDRPSQSIFYLSPSSVSFTEIFVICNFKNIC